MGKSFKFQVFSQRLEIGDLKFQQDGGDRQEQEMEDGGFSY